MFLSEARYVYLSVWQKNLFHQLEVAGGVFAPWADEVGGELVAFINVAADFAYPFLPIVGWLDIRIIGCPEIGFDVLLVVGVGDAGAVAKHTGFEGHGDEHGVGAEVDALGDHAADDAVDVLWQIEQAVVGTQLLLAVGELVDVTSALEAEMLERLHGGFLRERAEVEFQCLDYHVVRQVAFVDANHNPQRVAGDLLCHVDDAGVVLVALSGNKHKEAVADIE